MSHSNTLVDNIIVNNIITKFLVKISQFEFLVMTEKNIFLIKYFRFQFIFL